MCILLMRMSLLNLIDSDGPLDASPSWIKADKWTFSEIYFRCKPEARTFLIDTMSACQA